MDFYKVKRLYHTLKYLKFTQVYHQIKYRLDKPKRVATPWEGSFLQITLSDFPDKQKSLSVKNDNWIFDFLNLKQSFSQESLNWSFGDYGMLWTYNLNYFDWLHQDDVSKEQGLETLSQFYATHAEKNPIILHPYPTSLRIINTAKFISKWNIKKEWLYYELVSDLKFLNGRLEYHLLANHLLENAFALYIGGLITNQNDFTQKGKKLLVRELKEQVLNDGMHYERSPMYHLIILERLLDALNFASASNDDLQFVLKSYATRMTGLAINWEDLDRIPMMQDSAYDIALPVPVLLKYSKSLLGEDYPSVPNGLQESGYRSLSSGNLSLFANVGSIGPTYQPGHAHADELNFELFYKGKPVIVDTGVSTYEKNSRRELERSTISHNCITVGDVNTSGVWSGFRVGRRAAVKVLNDEQEITAEHNAYRPLLTSRSWSVDGASIIIEDVLLKKNGSQNQLDSIPAKGRLHIHPDVPVEKLSESSFKLGQKLVLTLEPETIGDGIWTEAFEYAKGYNRTITSKVIVYNCSNKMKIKISEAC